MSNYFPVTIPRITTVSDIEFLARRHKLTPSGIFPERDALGEWGKYFKGEGEGSVLSQVDRCRWLLEYMPAGKWDVAWVNSYTFKHVAERFHLPIPYICNGAAIVAAFLEDREIRIRSELGQNAIFTVNGFEIDYFKDESVRVIQHRRERAREAA